MRFDYIDNATRDRFNKKKNLIRNQEMPKKLVNLPDFQLFDEKAKLEHFLSKEANGEILTDEE